MRFYLRCDVRLRIHTELVSVGPFSTHKLIHLRNLEYIVAQRVECRSQCVAHTSCIICTGRGNSDVNRTLTDAVLATDVPALEALRIIKIYVIKSSPNMAVRKKENKRGQDMLLL